MDTIEQERTRLENLDISAVMSTENGRSLLWRIISYCGIYRDCDSDTTVGMARHLGRQSVGKYILHIVSSVDEESVFRMMREAKERQADQERAAQKETEKVDDEFNFDKTNNEHKTLEDFF